MAWHWTTNLGGKVARLWNVYGWERPTIKSHVITDLVLSGLKGRVRCMTDGREQRRFLYKSDCVAALIQLFDGPQQSAEIAAPGWVTIRHVAEEISRQVNVETQFAETRGSECLVDPKEPLPDWEPKVSLSEGLSSVITEARRYLTEKSAAV
jgi:nucleoside-diphosphate-sugar epimerase